MNNEKFSVDDAVDQILAEETVGDLKPGEFITKGIPCPEATKNKNVRYPKMSKDFGMMDVFTGRKGKPYEKKDIEEDSEEEDAESMEYDNYSTEIRSYLANNCPNGCQVYQIVKRFTPEEERPVMKVIQQMANKGDLRLDGSTVKLVSFGEGTLYSYASEDAEDDLDEDTETHLEEEENGEVDDVLVWSEKKKKDSGSVEDSDSDDAAEAAVAIHNGSDDNGSDEPGGEEGGLKADVRKVFKKTVSGSVSGIKLNQVVKELYNKTRASKPAIMQAIKDLLKSKELIKGPNGDTLIYNSEAEKNEQDEEVPVPDALKSQTPQNNTASYGSQPLSNRETPETLKAKGWKDNGNGLFVSPDGKQQFVFSNESKTINISTMNTNNEFDFEKLCEEFDEELNRMNNEEDLDQTEGLDELEDEGTEDDLEDDGDTVQVTLTKSEAQLLSDLASKLSGALSGEEDDMVDDEATDEAANADLMDDDEVSFDEGEDDDLGDDEEDPFAGDNEEDSEEVSDNSGAYTGAYTDGGASISKSGASWGPDRRKPIEGAYKPSAHGSAPHDGSHKPTGASMSKHNGSWGKDRRDPVPSRNSSLAGSKKSIFS